MTNSVSRRTERFGSNGCSTKPDSEEVEEVGDFLQRVPGELIYLTDFTRHSIGIILITLKTPLHFPVLSKTS